MGGVVDPECSFFQDEDADFLLMEGLLEFPLGSERRIGAAHLGRSQTLSGSARRLAPALSSPAIRVRHRPSVGRGAEQISGSAKIKNKKREENCGRGFFFV